MVTVDRNRAGITIFTMRILRDSTYLDGLETTRRARRYEWYEGILRRMEEGGRFLALPMGSIKKVMLQVE